MVLLAACHTQEQASTAKENTTTMLNLTRKKVRNGGQVTAARGSVSSNSIPQLIGNSNKTSSTNSKSSNGKASRDLPEVDSLGKGREFAAIITVEQRSGDMMLHIP